MWTVDLFGNDGSGGDNSVVSGIYFGGPLSTPTPTPTPTPPVRRSPSHVHDALGYVNSLLSQLGSGPNNYVGATNANLSTPAITGQLVSDLDSLTTDIEAAYDDFVTERDLFDVGADGIESQLLAAIYFSRANAGLASRTGLSSSVTKHLQRIAAHLAITEDLMLYGTISTTTANLAQAANARTDVMIGFTNAGYELGAEPVVAPLSLGSAFGSYGQPPLGTLTTFASLATDTTLPYELGGVSVTVGGRAVPLVYVSPSRVSFFVPSDLPLGSAEVIVTSQDGYVSRGTITISPGAFRIMTTADAGTGAAVVMNSRKQTGIVFEVFTPENFGPDKSTRLTIFSTGISGSAANSLPANDIMVNGSLQANFAESVMVEARLPDARTFSLPVEFAGAQGTLPGLDQVHVILPPELQGAGTVELTVIINGQRSNAPTIVIQ